jgi:hypothetical protein
MRALIAMCVAGLLVEAAGWYAGIAGGLYDSRTSSGILGLMLAAPVAAVAGLLAARGALRRPVPWQGAAALLVSGFFLAGLGLLAPESKLVLAPYADTCFAPGFQRERFSEVRVGMSPAEVETLLGGRGHSRETRWGYRIGGSPDQIWSYSHDHCSPFWDHAWRSYEVGFRNGTVVSVSDAWRYD